MLFTSIFSFSPDALAQGQGDPVPGFADLHVHMFMAEAGFGGGWMWGRVSGPVNVALPRCDGGFNHGRQLLAKLPFGNCAGLAGAPWLSALTTYVDAKFPELMSKATSAGDIGLHANRRDGFPNFSGWPMWDSIGHEQVWEGHLKDAHQNGLSLLSVIATEFSPLCKIIPAENRAYDCDEMTNVETQLNLAHAFARNNSSWVEIALTPLHARQIIGAGKLALVLGIETSDLFGREPNIEAQLDKYFELGVRVIQPAHLIDSRFAGVVSISPAFQVLQFLEPNAGPQCYTSSACPNASFNIPLSSSTVTVPQLGFDLDSNCKVTRGLTAEGVRLINGMIERHMLIDISHLSEVAILEIYRIVAERQYYPIFTSHAAFRDVYLPDHQSERDLSVRVADWIRQTGGVIGLLPGPDELQTYGLSSVANTCDGSIRSFAQMYDYGVKGIQADIAFGSDLNCFTAHMRPRLGDFGACSGNGIRWLTACQARKEKLAALTSGRTADEFDNKGLAHVGVLDNIVRDLESLGSDTSNIKRSSEAFVRMWERTSDPARAAVSLPVRAPGVLTALTFRSQSERKKLAHLASATCGSDAPFTPCNLGCRVVKEVCSTTCTAEKLICKTDCRKIAGVCKNTCIDIKESCIDSCEITGTWRKKRVCKRTCRAAKRDCKRECSADRDECKTNCTGGGRVCKTNCRTNVTDNCLANCVDPSSLCTCAALDGIK